MTGKAPAGALIRITAKTIRMAARHGEKIPFPKAQKQTPAGGAIRDFRFELGEHLAPRIRAAAVGAEPLPNKEAVTPQDAGNPGNAASPPSPGATR